MCSGGSIEMGPRSGQAVLNNLVTLCRDHHWKVHQGGWRLLRPADGFRAVAPVPSDLGRSRPVSADEGGAE